MESYLDILLYLTPLLFIEVPVPRQESECYIYMYECYVYMYECYVYMYEFYVYMYECYVYMYECYVYMNECYVYMYECYVYMYECYVYMYECYGYRSCLCFLRCLDWILELFRQCGIFCFSFFVFLLNTIETILFHSIVSLCLLHWMNILTYQYTILCTYNHHMSIHAPCGRVFTNKYSIYIAFNKPRSFGSLQYSYSCTCM